MATRPTPHFSGVVEGIVDEAVVRRLLDHVGAGVGDIHVKNGKPQIVTSLPGFIAAAKYSPWLVVVDLDGDAPCAPAFLRTLPAAVPGLLLRVAVREIEAWILGDRERIAEFLGISIGHIPRDPDSIADPKETLVALARRSRRKDIREDIVPRIGSGRRVGPAYGSRVIEFVRDTADGWRPDRAAGDSVSLARCLAALRAIHRRAVK